MVVFRARPPISGESGNSPEAPRSALLEPNDIQTPFLGRRSGHVGVSWAGTVITGAKRKSMTEDMGKACAASPSRTEELTALPLTESPLQAEQRRSKNWLEAQSEGHQKFGRNRHHEARIRAKVGANGATCRGRADVGGPEPGSLARSTSECITPLRDRTLHFSRQLWSKSQPCAANCFQMLADSIPSNFAFFDLASKGSPIDLAPARLHLCTQVGMPFRVGPPRCLPRRCGPCPILHARPPDGTAA